MKFYEEKNNCYPEKIIYYRFDTSKGEHNVEINNEGNTMSEVFATMETKNCIEITIISVEEAQNTRFFPSTNNAINNNVPPGTIIDTEIVDVDGSCFYLIPHKPSEGLAAPIKCRIIRDEANHSIDELQGVTYDLCHLFSYDKYMKTSKFPVPLFYARKIAERGVFYIQ